MLRRKNEKKRSLFAKLALLSLLFFVSFIYFFTEETLSNIEFESISMEGMNRETAYKQVEELFSAYSQKTTKINIDDETTLEISTEELGISYKPDKTINSMFLENSMVPQLKKIKALTKDPEITVVKPVFSIKSRQVENTIAAKLTDTEYPPQNARIVWSNGIWSISKERLGRKLKTGEAHRISNNIKEHLHSSATVPSSNQAQYTKIPADLTMKELLPLLEKIRNLTNDPIIIHYHDAEVLLDLSSDPEFITYDAEKMTAQYNLQTIREWIVKFAKEYARPSGMLTVTGTAESVSEVDHKTYLKAILEGNGDAGLAINQDKMYDDIIAILSDPAIEERVITVEDSLTPPMVTSELPDMTFPDLIGHGISSFKLGDYPDRVTNITTATSKFQGALVAPGEEFSFNRVLGWVMLSRGYKYAKVLFGGAIRMDVGGGVCQVSTTAYRAAVDAGFPITQRKPHSMDVSYYHEYGYGIDAASYPPGNVDLKFINDTDDYVLITTFVDEINRELNFYAFGTSDGREVELTNIPTGYRLHKKWQQDITWPDRKETRFIDTWYPK